MTHTPFGLRTNKLSTLLENPLLIYTKNFSLGSQSISMLKIPHLLINLLVIPPLPLPGLLLYATSPIVFVVVLLIPLSSPSPCV